MRSEIFGRLLKVGIGSIATGEGKTQPAIEDELGQQIGLTGASIQRYKAGHLPPELRTIEILAEAAVKRGYLNREWLQNFLHAAQYPAPERLLDKLCPTGPVRLRPPRIYENLPAPTYSQFVMRQQAFAEVVEGLIQRSAAVLIVGLGGNGKTSLAREVAARCLKGEDGVSQFDATVWVSDKDRPGTTNLSVVLDEIARTLDYPGFTQFAHDEKRREVEQLLRRQRVLVVIDNFETITDGALLSWLLNLPEPSKALITTREYRREFRRSSWPVDLRGMTEGEARKLITERVRVLKIEKLVGDLTQLEPLLVATGGNPKAIEMTMGLLKYERRPLQDVVDDLYAGRGELFDDLFARAWALLDEASRQVLLVMTFFPASASSEALSATADVQGFANDRAVEKLADLALLDVQPDNLYSLPRYTLHPLVRAFAGAKLAEQRRFEQGARERWVHWYVQFTARVGYCWNDLSKLELLDSEYDTALEVLDWSFNKQHFPETLQLAQGVWYYFQIRGLWDHLLTVEYARYEAAQRTSNISGRIYALRIFVHVFSRQGKLNMAEKYVLELQELMCTSNLSADVVAWCYLEVGLYWLAHGELQQAQLYFLKCIGISQGYSYPYGAIAQRSLALCMYQQGHLVDAMVAFREALAQAYKINHVRNIVYTRSYLAAVELDCGDFQAAHEDLLASLSLAEQYIVRELVPLILHTFARLHTLRGDLPAARASLAEAIDLFERLGMRRELAEAREEMARLEAQLAAPSSP